MLGSHVSNKTLYYLTSVVALGVALLLLIQFFNRISFPTNERYLSYNGVRGVAIEHNNLLYTLNFDQQNRLIDYINMALPVGKSSWNSSRNDLPFTKIVVYRFNQPDLIMTLVGIENQNLIFAVPDWNSAGYISDVTLGKFYQLMVRTYDT